MSLHPAHFWSRNSSSPLLQLCDESEPGRGHAALALLISSQVASLGGRCSADGHRLPITSSHKQHECLVRVNKAWRLFRETSF